MSWYFLKFIFKNLFQPRVWNWGVAFCLVVDRRVNFITFVHLWSWLDCYTNQIITYKNWSSAQFFYDWNTGKSIDWNYQLFCDIFWAQIFGYQFKWKKGYSDNLFKYFAFTSYFGPVNVTVSPLKFSFPEKAIKICAMFLIT